VTVEEERRRLLAKLGRLNGHLEDLHARVDMTVEEAADLRLTRLRRLVDATEEHLIEVIEAERMLTVRLPESRRLAARRRHARRRWER